MEICSLGSRLQMVGAPFGAVPYLPHGWQGFLVAVWDSNAILLTRFFPSLGQVVLLRFRSVAAQQKPAWARKTMINLPTMVVTPNGKITPLCRCVRWWNLSSQQPPRAMSKSHS
jgi:hypothetical protein